MSPATTPASVDPATTPAVSDNALRFRAGARSGHVESYFLRANHPAEPRALWLKSTILSPGGTKGAVSEAWCCLFDGTTGRTFAAKQTVPFAEAAFGGVPLVAEVAGCRTVLGAAGGESAGELVGAGETASWDLRFEPAEGPLGAPLLLFPSRRMVDGGFPRSKLLTPSPVLRFAGHLQWGAERIDVRDWTGMQGHNWGREHAFDYAWGQCVFPDSAGRPHCMAEGFSGRIKLAGVVTPRLSSLVVRRGERSWRFDRLFDFWSQRAEVGDLEWSLRLRSGDGEASLSMKARPESVVCLGYRNPGGGLSHCLNSKLAAVTLRVNPVDEDGFECRSEHGGALEFLRRAADPRFPVLG